MHGTLGIHRFDGIAVDSSALAGLSHHGIGWRVRSGVSP